MDEFDDDFEDNEIEDCPACGREYDEIDADYLICSHCGWDEEKKRYKRTGQIRSMKGYGIDPDVTHKINNDYL